ncbi:lytic murein transglycosylase [uncultured Xylophilus sp.]|uniref:lytic murein transglycosylase n=1 Tax=uncultured Xylophilus sp. TaxID=296832 RepID=UPI0025CCBA9A|nr:lytic murein transglycosylase [uncultured Xylophilus sp.]
MPARSLLHHTSLLPVAAAAALLVGCANAPPPRPSATPPAVTTVPQPSLPTSSTPVAAEPELSSADPTRGFAAWRDTFRAEARAQGIREATLRDALDSAQYLPVVIERDRSQPEFTRAVWTYLDSAVSPQRVANGREKLRQVRPEADRAAARYGVPASTIAGIWGMESNYGSNFGDLRTVDALATLAYDGRRRDWARGELLAALKIIDNGDIDREHMRGSWAGAMGHTQFLPSSFLAYAVDADGDGRRDIWGSMPDVLASTANYLARAGWQSVQPWGVEVQLPTSFDYGRADMAIRQPAAAWSAEGVRRIDGSALPPSLTDAAVLLPAGARGPAFLVGPNFRAILRYNNSTSYALAVGVLSDRIDGGEGVRGAWPRDSGTLSRSQVREMQALLAERGHPAGTPDGLIGPATRDAVRQYQRAAGLPADGYPSSELLERLRAQ